MKYYDNVLKSIDFYMQDKDLNNAFFINGKWGSGKSYFVKNVLTSHMSTQYDHKVIYISLYGVVNVDEIAKQIYSKLIAENRINKNRNRFPFKSKSIATEYAKDTAIATAKNLIPMLLSKVYITMPKIEDYWKYITLQKIILIFDDLERSRIDTIELMGCINNFVEEYGIKTIVVGNEDEIKKRFFVDNFVEKVEVVKDLKLPIIDDEEKDKYRSILFKESEVKEIFDAGLITTNLNTISKKIEYLFSTYEKYDKIKEKLIGYTFEFAPPIKELFYVLAGNDIIKRNIDFIERIYTERNCSNLRTFIFSKHAFNQLYDTISELDLKNFDDLIDIIVENTFYCSLELKNPVDKLNENPYRVFNSTNENVPQSVVNSINEIIREYLNTLELDYEVFALQLFDFDSLISEFRNEIENSLKQLQTYWLDKEDEYIESSLREILEMLKNNTLNIQSYPTLLSYIYLYNDIFNETKIDIGEIIKLMISNINKYKEKVAQDFGVNLHISYWPENKEEMSRNLDILHEEVENHNLSITDQSINSFFKNVKWSAEFLGNLRDEEKKWKFTTEKNFVSLIDVDQLANLIIAGTAEDLSNVYQAFKFVYSFSNLNEFFQNDIDNLVKLKKNLSEGVSKVKSNILVYSMKKFISYLEEKINIISENKQINGT
ncbi:P-loop NTPase fold protein [Mariniplasma anaerobium]|uniref:KAP NTPase domain-containing protein n=1 Tax=Mariniplasma anaerobium TaxID=2735436 RepID=A0A7U9XVF9_9MOLU|nr:P-loop NTPase fold protein [Mariniplasma anaerobium]BCR36129.1 hypothetical protein MPAN_010220 [Mariniplasma anaerobium]